jgi:hypothetical protein
MVTTPNTCKKHKQASIPEKLDIINMVDATPHSLNKTYLKNLAFLYHLGTKQYSNSL